MRYKDKAISTFKKTSYDIGDRSIEVASRKRLCHVCQGIIPKGEHHMALYRPPRPERKQFFKTRINTCMICAQDTIQKLSIDMHRLNKMVKKYLKDNPQIQNRVLLRAIKDGTALEPEETETKEVGWIRKVHL